MKSDVGLCRFDNTVIFISCLGSCCVTTLGDGCGGHDLMSVTRHHDSWPDTSIYFILWKDSGR